MKFFIALVFALAFCSFASAQGFDGGWIITQYNPQNATQANIYSFGTEQAQVQAISSGEDPNGDWVFGQVNSLEVNLESDGWYYRFNVEITQGSPSNATELIFIVLDTTPLDFISWELN